jgi:hypothetical protein
MVSSPILPGAGTSFPAPFLSVVVPLYNCLALTQAMLASLRATLPAGLEYETILVGDGSTDGTRMAGHVAGSALSRPAQRPQSRLCRRE